MRTAWPWFGLSIGATCLLLVFAQALAAQEYLFPVGVFPLGFIFGLVMPGRYWLAPAGVFIGQLASGLTGAALGSEGLGLCPIALIFLLDYTVVSTVVSGVGTLAGVLFYRWRSRASAH